MFVPGSGSNWPTPFVPNAIKSKALLKFANAGSASSTATCRFVSRFKRFGSGEFVALFDGLGTVVVNPGGNTGRGIGRAGSAINCAAGVGGANVG